MRTVSTRAIAILIIGMVVSFVGSTVSAETFYETDFSDTTAGEMPAGWTVMDNLGIWEVDEYSELTLSSLVAGEESIIAYDASASLTDYTVTATFHDPGTRAGVVGRQQNATDFYSLRAVNNGRLELYWLSSSSYGLLKRMTGTGYTAGSTVTVSMTFDGDNIHGELRNSSGGLMTEFDVTDTHYGYGKAGVRLDSTEGGFSHFSITNAVPEPGAVALLISALAGVFFVRRKR